MIMNDSNDYVFSLFTVEDLMELNRPAYLTEREIERDPVNVLIFDTIETIGLDSDDTLIPRSSSFPFKHSV